MPYYFNAKDNNAFLLYNNVRIWQNESRNDFRAEEIGVDPVYIKAGVDAIISDVIRPFADKLWEYLDNASDEGWKFMQSFDEYSMRAYVSPSREPRTPK